MGRRHKESFTIQHAILHVQDIHIPWSGRQKSKRISTHNSISKEHWNQCVWLWEEFLSITLWNDCGYTIMSRKIVEFHITKWFHTMGHPNMVVFPLISIGIRKVFFGKSIERPQPSHWEGSTSHLHQLWHLYKYEGWESFWTFIKSRTYWSSCRWFGHLRKFHK